MAITREQFTAIGFCAAGLLLLLTNKQFGELCRQWQITAFNRDYGILSFRVPIVIIGALLLLIGIGFFFSSAPSNNSLDRSGGRVFGNQIGAGEVALIRASR